MEPPVRQPEVAPGKKREKDLASPPPMEREFVSNLGFSNRR